MTHPDSCYRLVVAGPPSRLLVDTIHARFGSEASVGPSGRDTAVLLTADQSSLRALLTLLWDVGHELVTVSACPDQQEPDAHPHPLDHSGGPVREAEELEGPMMSELPAPASTTVCIAGCGPAGAMLSLMLARAGVDVVVLEQYPDFFRDFRGDTIHASTLQVLDELGLLPGFEKLPQQRTTSISMVTDEGTFTLGDFTQLPGKFQSLSMVPQWDFLDFIIGEAEKYPTFRLQRRTRVTGLLEEEGTVHGVRYETDAGEKGELRALLTVAADGRHSTVRTAARLSSVEYGAPIDLLWYRIPKGARDPEGSFARLFRGRFLPMIDRGSYWQGAYTMPKGAFATMKAAGIETLRDDVRSAMPFLADRVDAALRTWDDTGFLEVRVNRLRRWYSPGLLCIGDAAHAMSPVAGVGINLAIQDAVAAANLLVAPLRNGRVTTRDLARVQRRRSLPARLTQRVQMQVQKQIIPRSDSGQPTGSGIPPALRVMTRMPLMQRYFSRFMAIGVRNEHVRQLPVRQRSAEPSGASR